MSQFDPFKDFRMQGHSAIVTGGAQNIGAAIARSFAGAGAKVLKLDRKTFQSDFDSKLDKPADHAKSPADLAQYGQKVSMYFGVYVGMLTAVGMQERDSFCGAALEMLAQGEGRYWQAIDAAKPGAQGKP